MSATTPKTTRYPHALWPTLDKITFADVSPFSSNPLPKQHVQVLGQSIAFHETGKGPPIICFHGNPTSSYHWRNVIPYLANHGRVIAFDMAGFGDSSKLEFGNEEHGTIGMHLKVIDAFIDIVIGKDTGNIVLAAHDWGTPFALDWARRHPDRVKGIGFSEGPFRLMDADDLTGEDNTFGRARIPKLAYQDMFDNNLFPNIAVPCHVVRPLSYKEWFLFNLPFVRRDDRWPIYQLARKVPTTQDKGENADMMTKMYKWLHDDPNTIPKMFIMPTMGGILNDDDLEDVKRMPNMVIHRVEGRHYYMEDQPHQVGMWYEEWIKGISIKK